MMTRQPLLVTCQPSVVLLPRDDIDLDPSFILWLLCNKVARVNCVLGAAAPT